MKWLDKLLSKLTNDQIRDAMIFVGAFMLFGLMVTFLPQ